MSSSKPVDCARGCKAHSAARQKLLGEVREKLLAADAKLYWRYAANIEGIEDAFVHLPSLSAMPDAPAQLVTVCSGCRGNGCDAYGEYAAARFVLHIEFASGEYSEYSSEEWRKGSGLRATNYYAAAVGMLLSLVELARPDTPLAIYTVEQTLANKVGRWGELATENAGYLKGTRDALAVNKPLSYWWMYSALDHVLASARAGDPDAVRVEWKGKASPEMGAAVRLYDSRFKQ